MAIVIDHSPIYNPLHPDIGTQIFSFDGQGFDDLTAQIDRGFDDPMNRYAWASAVH